MKKLFLLLMFISCIAYAQKGMYAPTVNIIGGALPQDSIDARIKYTDTTWFRSSLSKSGLLEYSDFYTFTLASTRAGLLVADSTKWNAKVNVADSNTVGVAHYVTPTNINTSLSGKVAYTDSTTVFYTPTQAKTNVLYADSSSVAGTAKKYITPTMVKALYLPLGGGTITGSISPTDSTTSVILKSSDGKKWKLRVMTNGTLHADSTGLN